VAAASADPFRGASTPGSADELGLYSPIVDSASALSTESPREPIEVIAPASASRSCSGSKGTAHLVGVRPPQPRGRPGRLHGLGRRLHDNAITGSFFAILECELLHRQRFRTQTEARVAVFDCLEGFYNPRRRHSALGQLSPADYERSQQAQYAAAPALTRPPNRLNSRTTSDGHTGVRQSPITLPVMVISSFSIGS
jgi:hypothetical protein